MRQERFKKKCEPVGIDDTGELAGRMHRKLGDADIDRRDAETRCGDRANCGSAGHVVARDKRLHWDSSAFGQGKNVRGTWSVGAVSGIGVPFEDRAAIEKHGMIGLVTFGPIWMRRMSAIGGDAQ